ncbi:MAG: PAS domain S-box protein [Candidatus Kapaibacterium sp.]
MSTSEIDNGSHPIERDQQDLALLRGRSEFLAKVSELLASSLDFKTTLSNAAHLAVPHIADWCAIDICGGEYCDDPSSPQRLAVVHVQPEKIELVYELERKYPPDPNAPTGLPQVLRSGQVEFYPMIPPEMLTAAAIDDEHLEMIRKLGLISAMTVPLISRNRILGALTLVTAESGRYFTDDDLSLAEDLARRAAVAIDNSILYKQARQAEIALRGQLDFTSTMMASLGQGVCALDQSGNISYLNPAAERMLGWSMDELMGRNLHATIHHEEGNGESSGETTCPLLSAIRSGRAYRNDDDRFFRKNGSRVPVELNVSPIISDGAVSGVVLAFNDITERKEHERTQHAQREWLQVTLSSIGDAVIATDIGGSITFLNMVAAELTGWPQDEAIGRNLAEVFRVVNESTGELIDNPVEEVIQTGRRVGLANHTILVSRRGEEIPIDDSAAPILDFNGMLLGVILVFQDITDRKRSEEALRRSNQKTTRLLESITNPFIALNREWQFSYVNQRAETMLGLLRSGTDDLLGKDLWAEFPDLIWGDIYERFHQAMRELQPVDFDFHLTPINAWYHVNAFPSYDGLSVFFQDTTERKQFEVERDRALHEARESEGRFRDLVNTLAGIFWEADAGSLRFTFVSRRAEDLLGYPVSEWLNNPAFREQLIHPDDRRETLEMLAASIHAGRDHDLEYRVIAAAGRVIWLRDIVYVVRDEDGKPEKLRGVMVDITGRKESEPEATAESVAESPGITPEEGATE